MSKFMFVEELVTWHTLVVIRVQLLQCISTALAMTTTPTIGRVARTLHNIGCGGVRNLCHKFEKEICDSKVGWILEPDPGILKFSSSSLCYCHRSYTMHTFRLDCIAPLCKLFRMLAIP